MTATEQKPAPKRSKWQIFMLIVGIIAILVGVSILSVMGIRKIRRDLHRQQLLRENVSVVIPELHIRVPVLEGTEQSVLREAAGHFTGTGDVGSGNYCIAGHSSPLYREDFNNLKNVKTGMEIFLVRPDKSRVSYTVTDRFIVEPNETWILDDFGDCRVTLVTCTDDGEQRIIVVAKHTDEDNTEETK